MASYDALHRQCRTLESLFDTKLTAYARLAASASVSSSQIPSGDIELGEGPGIRTEAEAEDELEELLEKLEETNYGLDNLPSESLTPAMKRAIQRHRDVCADYGREFSRTRANAKAARDRAGLLSGVRNDIDAYKSSAADSLLEERSHIDSSHRMTDEMISQAYETRSEFGRQRSSLGGIQTRMAGVLNTMPGVDKVVSMISTRRRRDAIILGVLIGALLLILLGYIGW